MSNGAKDSLIKKARLIVDDAQALLDNLATAQQVGSFLARENAELRRLLGKVIDSDDPKDAETAKRQAEHLLSKKAAVLSDFLFQELAAEPAAPQRPATKFIMILPSAQTEVPLASRRTRVFIEGGPEIVGILNFAVGGGELSIDGFRKPQFVTLELPREAFQIKQ